jgi:hypothetical protein
MTNGTLNRDSSVLSPLYRWIAAGLFLLLLYAGSGGIAFAESHARLVSAPYGSLLEAGEAARSVDAHFEALGVIHDGEANVYRLVLEESADPADMLAAQRAAGRAGLGGLQVVPVEPDSPAVTPVGYVSVSSFSDRDEALQEASRAQIRGDLADVQPVRSGIELTSVQLTGFSLRADARRVARALEAADIEARILSPTHERGFVVTAGAFRDRARARVQAERIAGMGYDTVRLVPLRGQVERYEVVIVSREAPPDLAPRPGAITVRRPPVDDTAGVLELGVRPDPVPVFAEPAQANGPVRVGFDELRAEAGVLRRDSARADGSHYLHAGVRAEWPINERWSARLAARLDGYVQTGDEDFSHAELDYGESYVRYRARQRRVTLGAQKVLWGRMDEHAPTDRLSVQDVTRFALDDLPDRRRAVAALRWEEFVGDYKVDMLLVPAFRAAELPRDESVWSPVDRSRGRIIGMPEHALMAPLISQGRFVEDDGDWGGWGVRVSRAGRGFDYAFTLQDARHSLPYYELNPAVRAALLANPGNIPGALAAAPDTFIGRYPRTWVVGGDLGFSVGRSTWRFEAAWLSDHPATTEDLRYVELEAVDWAAGVEFFPGDTELRVNLQVGGRHLLDADEELLDRENIFTLFGDAENTFARERWRTRLRFSLGLDKRDVYLNPEVAFIGWDPHEIYAAYHHFDGDDSTLGGFHRDHDLFTVGWRARY